MKRLDNVDSTPTQRWTFLAIISLGLLLVGVDNSILYTALPELRAQLHTSEVQALWIINAYPLVLAGLMLGTGTLGDRIGHRLMFLIGLSIFGLASLAAAFAPDAWFLVAARAALGLGAATMMPATLALVRITFSNERELNTAVGVWGSVAVVGAALGPVLGGLLLEYFWWGSVFLINVPIAVLAIIATIAIAPPNMPNPAKHWDAISSFYALLALSALVTAIKELANPARTWWLLILATVLAAIGAVLFTRRQKLLDDPLLTFDIFRSRIFTGGVLAAAGAMFAIAGLELMTTQRFQLIAGYSPLEAGLLVVSVTLTAFPFSILGGVLLHRVGFQPLIAGGFLAVTVGAGLAAWAGLHENVPLFVAALAIVGAGSGSIMSVSSTAIIGAAPVRRAGMAAGVENVSYEFGTLLSVAIMGSLLPLLYNRQVPGGLDLSGTIDGEAYDLAYFTIVVLLTAIAGAFTLLTAWCFRGNPRSARATQ